MNMRICVYSQFQNEILIDIDNGDNGDADGDNGMTNFDIKWDEIRREITTDVKFHFQCKFVNWVHDFKYDHLMKQLNDIKKCWYFSPQVSAFFVKIYKIII